MVVYNESLARMLFTKSVNSHSLNNYSLGTVKHHKVLIKINSSPKCTGSCTAAADDEHRRLKKKTNFKNYNT